MRDLVLKMSMSIDGYVAGGRTGSDWMFRAGTPDSAAWVVDTLAGAGTHIAGRGLFEIWAATWPTSASPMAGPINDIEKVVFSRNPDYRVKLGPDAAASSSADSYAGARVASGELTTEIDRLKSEPGGYILAQGGVEFARDLVRAGVVDEYRLVVLPVALGSGDGIFTSLDDELDLELVDSTAFTGGVLALTYRVKG